MPVRAARNRALLIVFAALVCLMSALSQAANVTHTFDANGRLIRAESPNGDSAVYTYDAVGNLVDVVRTYAPPLAISGFTPAGGGVNTWVTISGDQFSTVTTENLVKFGGVAATVQSATVSRLVVRVPAGAASGPISVTTDGVTVSSAQSFVFGADPSPTITALTPAIVNAGSSVLIVSGSNFDTIAANNQVTTVSAGMTPATSATATSLQVTVPVGASTGPITVTTLNGSRQSTQELFVAPPGYVASDFVASGRLYPATGAALASGISTAGKKALFVFTNTATQIVTLNVTGVSLTGTTVLKVLDAGGSLVDSTTFTTSGVVRVLPYTSIGTYYVTVEAAAGATGNFTIAAIGPTDLSVTAASVTGSTIAMNGDGTWTLPVSFTVQNIGTLPASAPWTDRLYIANALNWANGYYPLTGIDRNTSLAPGASYTVTQNITVPAGTAADAYYLFVVADQNSASLPVSDYGNVAETSEANNLLATASPVTLAGPPDLTVTTVTLQTTPPIAPNANGTYSVPISFTVANNGAGTANGTWKDTLYLSSNNTLGTGDIYLTQITRATPLAVNATYTVTQTITVPATVAAGNWYLIVRTDQNGTTPTVDNGNVAESNETNNVRATSTAFALAGRADLTVTALTGPSAAVGTNADGSYTLPINFTVKNQGASSAPPSWTDAVYLSSNNTLGTGDVNLAMIPRTSALAVNGTYTVAQNVTVPNTVAAGSYFLLVQSDQVSTAPAADNGVLVESNESNNLRATAASFTLQARPDLTVTALTVPTSAIARNANGTHTLSISFTVKNQGVSTAQPSWTDAVFVSADTTLASGDTYCGNVTRSTSLAANGTYTVTQSFTIPASVAAGQYYVIVRTDQTGTTPVADNGALTESDETNNQRVSATKVTLSP